MHTIHVAILKNPPKNSIFPPFNNSRYIKDGLRMNYNSTNLVDSSVLIESIKAKFSILPYNIHSVHF